MSRPVPARRARRLLPGILLGLALAAAPGSARAQSEEGGELLDGIAAQVGSEIVLISDVNQVAAPAVRGLRAEGADDRQIAMLKVEVLERMIERALIRQVVRRAELEASEFEVDEAIDAIAAENDLTLEQLKESVESQGLPYEAYRQRIKEEIEHTKVMNGMVGSQVRIDEQEIRDLYEKEYSDQPVGGDELRLRHVLVSADPQKPASVEEACRQVRAAAARVRAGEPFPEVAEDVSEVNPKQGGELGWVHRRFLADWMGPIVDGMQPGDVSDVISMPFGCNLIQLVDRRPYERITYDEVREQLRRRLFSQRMSERYAEFIEELREQTYIERKGIYAEASRLRAERGAEPSEPPGTF
ncbi:MAG: SurA N-terminal domain-containing protein [Myxococcota bacterium]|nr:SurA N-terminal domain-containing protein [Myxococcota bacterium]